MFLDILPEVIIAVLQVVEMWDVFELLLNCLLYTSDAADE